MMATVYQGDEWMKARMERKKVAVHIFLQALGELLEFDCAASLVVELFASIEGVLLFDEAEALRASAAMAAERAAAHLFRLSPRRFRSTLTRSLKWWN